MSEIKNKLEVKEKDWYNEDRSDPSSDGVPAEKAVSKQAIPAPVKSASPKKLDPLKAVIPQEKDTDLGDLTSLVSQIIDIKPTVVDMLEITYKGISVFNRDKYLDPPYNTVVNPVHSLPIVFRINPPATPSIT